MARIRFSETFFATGLGGREMDFGHLVFAAYESFVATPTRLRFFDNSTNETVFSGTGLTYATGVGGLTDITGGRFTGARYEVGGVQAISVTGLDISAHAFWRVLTDDATTRDISALLLSGDDDIAGTTKADYITGGAGDDLVVGYQGADSLFGGAGDDTLTGGQGVDQFMFFAAPNAAANVDRITDFNVAADTMQLQNGVFAGLGAGGALGGRYAEGTSATQSNDRIIYNQATGRVFFDADGVGGVGKVLFATVDAGTNLSQADFLVV